MSANIPDFNQGVKSYDSSLLAEAVAAFNLALGYKLKLPLQGPQVQTIAIVADGRGYSDIGQRLRFALKIAELEREEVAA